MRAYSIIRAGLLVNNKLSLRDIMISVRPELVEGSKGANHIDNFTAVMVRQASFESLRTGSTNGLAQAISGKL